MNLTQSEELIRKKILTILGYDKQLISMAQAKLFTSTKETENSQENIICNNDEWLYSDLEGYLCYVLDFNKKCRYFRLYENTTFQVLFHMDIYQNFSNFYTQVEPLFHCFEINNIFIGFQFSELNSANNFQLMIKKLNDQIVQMMLDSENMKVKESRKERKKKFYENCEILKKNFGAENKYSRDYCEDCTEIKKPIFYELLNFMSYNRETKEFEVGNVPKEFRNLFKNMGIKKHMLKKADTTLNFFKYFIESLDVIETVNKRKISCLSYDDEEEDLDKIDEDNNICTEASSNYDEHISTVHSENKSIISGISGNANIIIKNNVNSELKNSTPKPPPIIPNPVNNKINIPPAPKLKLPVPTINENKAENINIEVDLLLINIYYDSIFCEKKQKAFKKIYLIF